MHYRGKFGPPTPTMSKNNMTKNQLELLNDEVIKCSYSTRHKIANVIREYDEKLKILSTELEQEKYISEQLESTLKECEEMFDRIDKLTENEEIKRMIENFKYEHGD